MAGVTGLRRYYVSYGPDRAAVRNEVERRVGNEGLAPYHLFGVERNSVRLAPVVTCGQLGGECIVVKPGSDLLVIAPVFGSCLDSPFLNAGYVVDVFAALDNPRYYETD